jgi:1-acyl-sn-glycerol-3-phosphate acyltransferase
MTASLALFTIFIIGAAILRFYAVTPVNKRRVSIWWTTKISRITIKVLNIKVEDTGTEYIDEQGKLIVSNHMSYIDILVYSSIKPSVFISSVEIEKTFFLGWLAKLGGTLFIERRNPKLIKLEIENISELIEEGFNVVLFPEGTSTDGSEILPFRSSLLAATAKTDIDVVPACLKYMTINSESFNSSNKDTICWYGDMSFAPHFLNLIKTEELTASAQFFRPLSSSVYDRKVLTRKAYSLIEKTYFGAA